MLRRMHSNKLPQLSRALLSILMLQLWSIGASSDEYLTNESEDNNQGAPHRVKIPPFSLTLYPEMTVTSFHRGLIEELADDVLQEFLPTKLDNGITLDYVDLIIDDLEKRSRRLRNNDKTVLQINGGIASFRGGEPTVDQVNSWVKEALEENLLGLLQEETDLNAVEVIEFTSLTPAPTSAPTTNTLKVIDGVQSLQTPPGNSSTSFSFIAIIVGSVAGVCLIILGLFVTLSSRRRQASIQPIGDRGSESVKQTPSGVTDGADDSDDDDGEGTLETGENLAKLAEHDLESESASASMWTMSTNATDAYTVKSGRVFPRTSHALMQTESFERDRQVSLKKDMLETTWSSAIPHERVKKRKDTLLTPSHFSVEQCASTDSYEADSAWNPDDNEVTPSMLDEQESPFVFAAPEEEVVLMPPSRVRSTRSGI